jgi:hypothetical protein
MTSDILVAVNTSGTVLCVMIPCSLVYRYHNFKGDCCFCREGGRFLLL